MVPNIGRSIFAGLSLLTYPIGSTVSFFMLAIIYFMILTPMGLFRKRTFVSGWINSTSSIDKDKLYE